MRLIRTTAIGATVFGAIGLLFAATPAKADWYGPGWHRHWYGGPYWRYGPPGYYYAPPPVVYSAPPVVYAPPPPPVYYSPGVSFGVTIR